VRTLARLTILCSALLSLPALAGTKIGETKVVVIPVYNDETGMLEIKIYAQAIERDPKIADLMKATGVRIEVNSKLGDDPKIRKHVITADRGNVRTEERTGELDGNTRIQFDDEQRTVLETDRLRWNGKKGVAVTQDPVTVTRKDMVITGIGMEADISKDGEAEAEPKTDPPKPPAEAKPGDRVTIFRRVRVVVDVGADSPLSTRGTKPKSPPEKDKPPAGKDKPEPPSEPIVITSVGSLVVHRNQMIAIFSDQVRVVQGSNTLLCDKLALRFDRVAVKAADAPAAEKKVQLVEMIAEGNVRVDDGKTVGVGDKLVWTQREQLTRLTGKPARVAWDDGQKLAADEIVRRTGDGQVVCQNDPDTGSGPVHFEFPVREEPPVKTPEGKQ
jgi:LPS export ABC transporter protein LptC